MMLLYANLIFESTLDSDDPTFGKWGVSFDPASAVGSPGPINTSGQRTLHTLILSSQPVDNQSLHRSWLIRS